MRALHFLCIYDFNFLISSIDNPVDWEMMSIGVFFLED